MEAGQGREEEAIRGMKTRRMEIEVKKGRGVMIEKTWCQCEGWRKIPSESVGVGEP